MKKYGTGDGHKGSITPFDEAILGRTVWGRKGLSNAFADAKFMKGMRSKFSTTIGVDGGNRVFMEGMKHSKILNKGR